jgi:A/G-specific adenine glycosylase
VGDYVSAAIRCFAFGERVPVIDTNTSRVVARFFGIPPRPELRRDARVRALLEQVVGKGNARYLNLAIIDLAALLCHPRVPACSRCPLDWACRREGVVEWT